MDEKMQGAAEETQIHKMTVLEKLEERAKDLREEYLEMKRLIKILKKNPKLSRMLER